MTGEDFQLVLDRRIKLTQSTLGTKAKEYSSANDRLHNFKRGAKLLGISPELYCMQLATKHRVSILDMIESGKDYPVEVWEEKIGDDINYLILLEGLVKERNDAIERNRPAAAEVSGLFCYPCQQGFITMAELEAHQRLRHGVKKAG